MREIKFRGFSKELNKWIYGNLIKTSNKFYIAKQEYLGIYECFGIFVNILEFEEYENIFEVEPNSIGQYIGIKDKNDKEIYEGDIVSFILPKKFGIKQESYIGVIKYDSIVASYKIYTYRNLDDFIHDYVYDYFYITDDVYIKVIGNVYENPEFLRSNNAK